jgi:hypothetical protein
MAREDTLALLILKMLVFQWGMCSEAFDLSSKNLGLIECLHIKFHKVKPSLQMKNRSA